MRNLFLVIGCFLALYACTNSKQLNGETESTSNFEVIYQSEYAGTGSDEFLILTNQNDFEKYWLATTFQTAEEIPTYDFKKKMVIAKSFESQRTGGFVYEIEKVHTKGNTVLVEYTITSPGDIVTQAITNPLTLIVVDKVENPTVDFQLK